MKKYVVTEPVVDLRREPSSHNGKYVKDVLQETQLLFGESLIGKEEKDGWLLVEAIEQTCFKGDWVGYPGWVKTSQVQLVKEHLKKDLVVRKGKTPLYIGGEPFLSLSSGTKLYKFDESSDEWKIKLDDGRIGSVKKSCVDEIEKLKILDESVRRKSVLELGKAMLGSPYLWGGRSSFDPDNHGVITSVDCSGLSSLLYRVAHGVDIPRDAHDQFLKCKPCNPSNLKIGDFIFFASVAKPERMNHVMIYAGYDEILEATEQTHSVQIISFKDKIGLSLKELSNQMKVTVNNKAKDENLIFFGSLN